MKKEFKIKTRNIMKKEKYNDSTNRFKKRFNKITSYLR